MRKVLSFVLVLALVLGSFSMAFAATPTDVVGTPNEEAVQVLMDLGVVNGYTDGSFKPAGIVTRAEMAKLIVVALGLGDYATATTTSFPDMAGATWAKGYVSYATGLGIIKGYPDGTFKPSATVSYTEAAAMIVRALGYTDASLLPATWPANYMVKATSLGILDDVDSAIGGANRGDIAGMLYNTLGLKIGGIDRDGFWVASASDTMLARLGAKEVAAAVITGAESTTINLRAYVGAYAKTYTDSGDIIAVVQPESTFLTGEFDGTKSTFTADDVDYTLSAAAQEDLFLNTVVASTSAIEFLNGGQTSVVVTTTSDAITYTLAVDLSNKTIKEVYSSSLWTITAKELFTVDMVKEMADKSKIASKEFSLNDNNDIDLNSFELLGASSLAALAKDNVLYIYTSNSKITRIEVGTAVVTGKITRVSSDVKDFTINGKIYNLAVAGTLTASNIGDTGTVKLDYFGDIYDWEVTDSTSDNYAVVVATQAAVGFGDVQVKLVTKDGSETIFNVASDAVLATWANIVSTTGPAYTATGASISQLITGDLVVYATDSDGKIDTLTEKQWAYSASNQLTANRTLFGSMLVDDAAVTFTASGTSIEVVKLSTVTKDTALAARYFADPKVEVLMIAPTLGSSGDSTYGVINTVGTELDADGNSIFVVSGILNGVAFTDKKSDHATFTASNIVAATSTPAIYSLTIDADGIITGSTKYTAATTVTAATVIDMVTVYDVSGLNFQATTSSGAWYAIDSSAKYYELDQSAKTYTLKSPQSISKDAVVTMWRVDVDSVVYDVVVVTVD